MLLPFHIEYLTLISCKISLSNDNVQEVQALFSTTEKCIQKKEWVWLSHATSEFTRMQFLPNGRYS